MPQAGLHGLSGMAVSKFAGKREWLLLGIILGTMLPDMDNIAVAVTTLAKMDPHGLHRTFTHSIFFVIAIMLVFYLIGTTTKKPRWSNLGLGHGHRHYNAHSARPARLVQWRFYFMAYQL